MNKTEFRVKKIYQKDNGEFLCEGYLPKDKPGNPICSFTAIKVDGKWQLKEFRKAASLLGGFTPVDALLAMSEEERTKLLDRLPTSKKIDFN